jgi:ubiquitin-activating enzyme E1
VWARLQFEEKYNNDIRQLLFSLPKDAVTTTGQPFWSGPKRAPEPLTFNSNDVSICLAAVTHFLTQTPQPLHLDFIIAASNLHAFNYGLKGDPDLAIYKKVADSVITPEFTPKSGLKIQINENDPIAPVDDGSAGT